MTPEQAAYVRESAWHPWMLSMHNDHVKAGHTGCFLFRMTPCQIMGVCERCQRDDHPGCMTRDRIENPRPRDPRPEINWSLSVGADNPYVGVAKLYSSCKGWLCPCGCWKGALPAPVEPEPVEPKPKPVAAKAHPRAVSPDQLDIFGELVDA